MRRYGKLNSTHHSKLQRCSTQDTVHEILFITRVLRLVYCGSYKFEGSVATIYMAAAVDEPQYTRDSFSPSVLWLVYCGSYIFDGSARDGERLFFSLVYGGAPCTAAATVGIDVRSLSPFIQSPIFSLTISRKKF